MNVNGAVLKEKLNPINGTENNQRMISLCVKGSFRFGALYKDKISIGDNEALPPSEEKYGMNGKEDGNQSKQEEFTLKDIVKGSIGQLVNNIMPEDYSVMKEMGLEPKDDDLKSIVTVSERIKIRLASCGITYNGAGNISADKVQEALGGGAMVQTVANKLKEHNTPVTQSNVKEALEAFELSKQIEDISDASKRFLLNNNLTLSINNVYMAEHSSAGNADQKSFNQQQWEKLVPQIEKLIDQSGIPLSLDDAKWMLENDIPLSYENMSKMSELNSMSASSDQTLDSIIRCMAIGMQAKDTPLSGIVPNRESVQNMIDIINNTEDTHLRSLIQENKEINAANLRKEQNSEQEAKQGSKQNAQPEPAQSVPLQSAQAQTDEDIKFIEAKRALEETRLQMTVEAGMKMLKTGMKLDTAPLEQIVETLKAQEQAYYSEIYKSAGLEGTAEETTVLKDTTIAMEQLKSIPSYIIGRAMMKREDFTLSYINKEGEKLRVDLEKANVKYETVWTTPRADLGDSLNKAFGNIGEILSDIGMEPTEDALKAVRTLAYNQMPIHEENIIAVKAANSEVERLIHNLNPKMAVHLIKNGINPLHMNIELLNEKIEELKEEIGPDPVEKYSEYLWKLEKNDHLSQDERDAYIGIYRLLHQIQKSDGAVVGSLVQQGADITLNNLLSAVRTKKVKQMDVEVSEKTGAEKEIVTDKSAIDNQLAIFEKDQADNSTTYYENLVKEVFEKITPESLNHMEQNDKQNISRDNLPDINLEQLLKYISEQSQVKKEMDQMYLNHNIEHLSTLESASDEAVDFLLKHNQKVTVTNLVIASYMLNRKGGIFSLLKEEKREDMKKRLDGIDQKSAMLPEALESQEEMQEAYENISSQMKHVMEEAVADEKLDYNRLSALRQISSGIHFVTGLSRNEVYEMPIEINGETASVTVTIIRGAGDKGKVTVNADTEAFGKIASEFRLYADRLKGTILVEEAGAKRRMDESLNTFKEYLSEAGINKAELYVGIHNAMKEGMFAEESRSADEERTVKTNHLYQIAKVFIKTIKEWNEY